MQNWNRVDVTRRVKKSSSYESLIVTPTNENVRMQIGLRSWVLIHLVSGSISRARFRVTRDSFCGILVMPGNLSFSLKR